MNFDFIDISKIDIDILKKFYYDLRLTPTITVYGDILSNIPMNEDFEEILSIDKVIIKICNKYNISKQLIKKEGNNIYIVIALIGDNDKIIKNDMQKMGYILKYQQPPQIIEDMIFHVLEFEPNNQIK